MLRRRPISTLFPYTTLFRSLSTDRRRAPLARSAARWAQQSLGHCEASARRTRARNDPRREHSARGSESHRRDRKSTRLNSSHLGISYAVFCLKKKKIDKDNN